MKKNSKKPFWKTGVNAITGWRPARMKKNDSCIESKPLRIKLPSVFKPRGFR